MEQPARIVIDDYGRRDSRTERNRLLAGGVLLLILMFTEWWLGDRLDLADGPGLNGGANDGPALFAAGPTTADLPSKPPGQHRLVYVSNSHAGTGGHVARHLQRLLDTLVPGQWQVTDMSAPGIFAPEMLQRVALAMELQPDLLVVAPAYISFGDRMRLRLQSLSVRSFFNPGVFERLRPDFWLRHYDLGLYLDSAAARASRLLRNRDSLRRSWQDPLHEVVAGLTGDTRILSLSRSARQTWRFPDGYDRNLFQWRLYAGDRDAHLADLADLIQLADTQGVPTIGVNLPLDPGKSVYSLDHADYLAYRRSIRRLFAGASAFSDQQEYFPVRFSTYDAIHPTQFGARLHALALALTLYDQGWLGHVADRDLVLQAALAAEDAEAQAYLRALDEAYRKNDTSRGFLRYDLTDPQAAGRLLSRLIQSTPGKPAERRLLANLSRRIDWWLNAEAQQDEQRVCAEDPHLCAAFKKWWQISRSRVALFARHLKALLGDRLRPYPLPAVAAEPVRSMGCWDSRFEVRVCGERFAPIDPDLASDTILIRLRLEQGPVFAWDQVEISSGRRFQRIDIFADGSFAMLWPHHKDYWIPFAMRPGAPDRRWGI